MGSMYHSSNSHIFISVWFRNLCLLLLNQFLQLSQQILTRKQFAVYRIVSDTLNHFQYHFIDSILSTDTVDHMYYSPDLLRLYCCEQHTNNVVAIDPKTGEQLQTLSGHAGAVTAVVHIHRHRVIVTASVDRTISVWDEAKGNCIYFVSTAYGNVLIFHFFICICIFHFLGSS